ncbi:LysM peptidoglycan-binding domain-containing protein [Marivibrio halodurans]|uniref:LysM peptidoglycan-binding domain-containing protein n=1 Tax=Marivibrio halodurans TaxID=2039722 RepID=A0A8J7V3D9_9PROT|nr:LysM peptidoglycan-binding domain-containing protein [Marivibrio halodurans]MBP5856729.1 LysM peptidoglycan-binding domain-containing protein [Marivibrio halodurans]
MNRTVLIGIAGAVIVLIALILNNVLNQAPIEEETAPSQTEAPGDSDGGADGRSASSDGQGDAIDKAGQVADQLSGASSPQEEPADPNTPTFDVVRISKSGDTVIAGRAKPGSEVLIFDGDKQIGAVTADERGEWVYLPDQPLEPGSHDLSLRARTPEGVERESDSKVVLVVPETGKDIAGRPTSTPQEPLAMLVPKEGKGRGEHKTLGARVLQKPSVPGSVESDTGELALDNVDYDETGRVSLGGRGLPGTEVRAYLNNELVGRAEVPPTGLWRVTPEGTVEPGSYQLRLDMVGEGGDVTARIELPFSRAKPMRDLAGGAFVVVQPGNSLWRIARRTLDSGYSYTVIYEANKEQIRDPDLIYPGQIFEVPAN